MSENIVSYTGPLGRMTVPASAARRRLTYLRTHSNLDSFRQEIIAIEGALQALVVPA